MVNPSTLRAALTWAIMVCVVALGASAQTTWYVDDDAPNDPGPGDPTISDPNEAGTLDHPFDAIQEGIDAAVAGDKVIVADGAYTGVGNRYIDFGGKAITVRSASGDPTLCTIDCGRQDRGFYFGAGEGPDSVINGLTIRRGDIGLGGGVYCREANPSILNCILIDNTASRGGGVFCYNASPALTDCRIVENSGCGVYCQSTSPGASSPTIKNCEIIGNLGGGVYCEYNCNPTLINSTINRNSSALGGGIYCEDCAPTFINCAVFGNVASLDGGGVYCNDSSPVLVNCTINANTAGFNGGGLNCTSWQDIGPVLANCTMSWNLASNDGGGIFCDGDLTLTNCTISRNTASRGGGIYYVTFDWASTFTNCVFYGDTSEEICWYLLPPLYVSYCDIQGGGFGTANNIDADPLFVDPDGPDDDPFTWEDNNFRLGPSSPCIDAGDNDAVPGDDFDVDNDGDTTELLPLDLNYVPRFVDDLGIPDTGNGTPPIVDIGAYEFQGQTCFGDLSGDYVIDTVDLYALLFNYGATNGATYGHGDLDADRDVDLADLATLLAVYGADCR